MGAGWTAYSALQLGKALRPNLNRLYIYGRFGSQARKARATRREESALALAPAGASGPAQPNPGPRGGVRVGTGTGTALGHRGTARQSLTWPAK